MACALFAQKLAREGMPGKWETASAGTWARNGYPAARESQELLAARGIDLSQHRSRIVTESLLKTASLVLVMEGGHKEALSFEFPAYKERIFLLSEMSGFYSDIQDPVGGTREDFLDTIREIDHWIEQGFPRIIELLTGRP
jgi:protein-tyrosine phosphatase